MFDTLCFTSVSIINIFFKSAAAIKLVFKIIKKFAFVCCAYETTINKEYYNSKNRESINPEKRSLYV